MRYQAMLAGAALAFGLAAGAARAEVKVGGAVFPDTFPAQGQNLKLNGAGVRVFFHMVNGYATALYMSQPAHTAQAIIDAPNPKVIYTEFLHDASLSRIQGEYNTIHESYCQHYQCNPTDEASYKEFVSHLEPASSGQTQTILITDSGVTVSRNNQVVQTINNPSFGKDLIRSLVGECAPTESYRNGIIGNAS